MMQSSLIPERPLVISPTLAATIGLEEAVMLHVIGEMLAELSAMDAKALINDRRKKFLDMGSKGLAA